MRLFTVGFLVMTLIGGGTWLSREPDQAPLLPSAPPHHESGPTPEEPPPFQRLSDLSQASAEIDRRWIAAVSGGISASTTFSLPPPVDEYTWLRRVYLDLAGRIPTVREFTAYQNDHELRRRERLVDQLLNSTAHVATEFMAWADLLRMKDLLGDRYPVGAYSDWLWESLAANTPYDVMVQQLWTANGPALARGNGATGFWLRDAGMPLDHLYTGVRAFLGTRIGCAQCQDHPFDVWSRADFFALAAMTNGAKVDRRIPGENQIRKQFKDSSSDVKNTARYLGDVIGLYVTPAAKGTITLPSDYQYDDRKPGSTMVAHALWGSLTAIAPTSSSGTNQASDHRAALATWMTGANNRRFVLVSANRLWKRVFGVGIVEPLDDWREGATADQGPLLEYLGQVLVSVDFDVRRFTRILVLTEAYSRQRAIGTAAPYPHRLTAEQLWDSLIALVLEDPESNIHQTSTPVYELRDRLTAMTQDQLIEEIRRLGLIREEIRQLNKERQQLQIAISDLDPQATRPNKTKAIGTSTITELALTSSTTPTVALLYSEGSAKDRIKELRERIKMINERSDSLREQTEFRKRRPGGDLVRAAALPMPAPQGHFLRVFGQSDRDAIDNSSKDSTLPQALLLMNSALDRAPPGGVHALKKRLEAEPSADLRTDLLWQAVLTRPPNAAERKVVQSRLAGRTAKEISEAWRDLTWALINHHEFRRAP
jgi:hypothetical protein